jgi:hypothetical protein
LRAIALVVNVPVASVTVASAQTTESADAPSGQILGVEHRALVGADSGQAAFTNESGHVLP